MRAASWAWLSPPAVSRPRRSEWPENRSASSPASAAACLTRRATALSERGWPVTRPVLVTAQNSEGAGGPVEVGGFAAKTQPGVECRGGAEAGISREALVGHQLDVAQGESDE